MSLTLYNTLTRRKEEFRPIDPANVRMYVCGPTVYDFAHIGNARPVIVFDVLYRLLRHLYGADHVTYARNITDVDDKINARAAEEYPGLPLNEAIRQVTEKTYDQYQEDVKAIGALPPDSQPRATEHIEGMKALIERLVARGFAYVAEDHVLFSPAAMDAARASGLPRYGALANRSLDEMLAGARVDVAPYKRDPMDFVLWKPSKPGEPSWASPAGIAAPGRPGWHIECSAMAMAKLLEPFGGGLSCDDPTKNVFDIHGGGIDLVFPHHENEMAQSCCAFGTARMANVWMHNGFLQVEGEKMSKSLGNFVTIRELLSTDIFGGQPWAGEVLRLAMLQTHYREPINWTESRLHESWRELADWVSISYDNSSEEFRNNNWIGREQIIPDGEVVESLSDDLNTPAAITRIRTLHRVARGGDAGAAEALSKTLTWLGLYRFSHTDAYRSDTTGSDIKAALIHKYRPAIAAARAITLNEYDFATDSGARKASLALTRSKVNQLRPELKDDGVEIDISELGGVSLRAKTSAAQEDTSRIQSLITARNAARAAKNFAESDRIRDELATMGIQLKDGKDPATGEPVTTWEVKR